MSLPLSGTSSSLTVRLTAEEFSVNVLMVTDVTVFARILQTFEVSREEAQHEIIVYHIPNGGGVVLS